jgi:hypothetical protein
MVLSAAGIQCRVKALPSHFCVSISIRKMKNICPQFIISEVTANILNK